jgi:molecular chaperone HtpG
LHDLPLKALALEDDECYRLFAPWFLFETSQGEMMLGEYRERHDVIRYVPHLESSRQIARVAAAQGMCIINGGYTYGADLLARYADLFPEASCEAVEPSALAQSFEELSAEEIEQTQEFLDVADAVLRPFGCRADLKKFLPPSLPALYASSSEGRFLRALEQAKELSHPTWTSVLDTLQRRRRSGTPPAELCFNYANALVRQLTALRDRALLKRALQLLYVQALLLGHQPLSHRELALMNDTLLAMIDSALAGAAARPAP